MPTEYVLVYENMFLNPAPDKNPFEPAKNPDGSWDGEPGALWMIDENNYQLQVFDKEKNRSRYFRLEKKWIDYIKEATDPDKIPIYHVCPSPNGCYCPGTCHRVNYYKNKNES